MKDFKQVLRERVEEVEGVTIQSFENGIIEISVYDENKDIIKAVCKNKVFNVVDNLETIDYHNFKFYEIGRIETEKRGIVACVYKIITPFTDDVIEKINKDRAEDPEMEVCKDGSRY